MKRILLIIIAFIVGLVYSAPNIYYSLQNENGFNGIAINNTLDEWAYTGFVREAAEGNWLLQNQYLFEEKIGFKPGYMTLQPVGAYVSGGILWLCGMNMNLFVIVEKFLFPLLLFLTLFWILTLLKIEFKIALIGSLTALLIPCVWFSELPFLVEMNIWHLQYGRPIINVAVLFFLLSFGTLLKYLNGKGKLWFWLTAILGALALQSYLFNGIAIITLIIFYTFLNYKTDKSKSIKLLLLSFITLVFSGWWIFWTIKYLQTTLLWDVNKFRYPHSPYFSIYLFFSISSLIFLYYYLRNNNTISKNSRNLLITIPFIHIIFLNQQIITGINLEPHHFEIFVLPPLTMVFICLILNDMFVNRRFEFTIKLFNLRKILLIILLLIFFIIPFILINYFPKPTGPAGGYFGKIVRGSYIITSNVLTWATLLPAFIFLVSYYTKRNKTFYLIISFIWILFVGIDTQIYSYNSNKESVHILQKYKNAFNWLNNKSDKESVVLSSPLIGDFLTSYTFNNSYFCDYGVHTKFNDFKKRFFNYLAFINFSPDSLSSKLTPQNKDYDATFKFSLFFWRYFGENGEINRDRGRYLQCYTMDEINQNVKEYSDFISNWNIDTMSNYRINYIIYGPIEGRDTNQLKNNWMFKNFNRFSNSLKPVYDDGNVAIYKYSDFKIK